MRPAAAGLALPARLPGAAPAAESASPELTATAHREVEVRGARVGPETRYRRTLRAVKSDISLKEVYRFRARDLLPLTDDTGDATLPGNWRG